MSRDPFKDFEQKAPEERRKALREALKKIAPDYPLSQGEAEKMQEKIQFAADAVATSLGAECAMVIGFFRTEDEGHVYALDAGKCPATLKISDIYSDLAAGHKESEKQQQADDTENGVNS